MNTLTSRFLLFVIIALLGVLGILRSNEGFANPPPRPDAKAAMTALMEATRMKPNPTPEQMAKLQVVVSYLKSQGGSTTTLAKS